MKNNKIIAIITARGGSKGIPKKNIIDLAGKPLIAYTIEEAKKSNIFDEVFVTTDNLEIAEVSKKYDAKIINRPEYLSTDSSSSLDAIEHALQNIKNINNYTYFMLLQPTSPLRTAQHIQESFNQIENSNSLISITESECMPYKLLAQTENNEVEPLFNWDFLSRPRQQFPKTFKPNGAIYISKINSFLKTKNLYQQPLKTYLMDKNSSIDIDNFQDLEKVRKIFKGVK
jgi:CMP-N-acetylneuraminic acid synthetase